MDRLWNHNYIKVWSANFMIFFSFMIVTPLLPLYLSEEFRADKDTIGLVLSGYTLAALIVRPFSGYLVDSFPRKAVLLISYFLFFAMFAGYIVAGTLTFFAIIRTLHGGPMGAVTVANSTCAIDVLPPSRRAEGIGYYGLSNNLATSIAPTVGLLIYDYFTGGYHIIFIVALAVAGIGLFINSMVHFPEKEIVRNREPLSLDRFFLVKGWRESIVVICFAFSYGVLATYLAIYGKEELGMTAGSGLWFLILSIGLILSRLIGARSLRQGKVAENASRGIALSLFGYLAFAAIHNAWGYYGAALIIGLGNGHLWPAMQTMFVNLAHSNQRGTANSTMLTSWDAGMGLGVIGGGCLAEYMSYSSAFWAAWIVNLCAVLLFFSFVRSHFLKNKLR
ncbi:MAG: MFS transporter [Bacteroidales bacterium]|nr:MFS transporter [Bacteroidales bacterium]